MCGIVGFTSPDKQYEDVESMLSVQSYRGPDDRGIYIETVAEKYIHFGHNRLSIQDVSSHGHQPFVSECGEYVIVFNGEVYNFKSIREELETLGCTFVSHSDTEVVLYAYKAWGVKCLDKFIGMFAFSILDKTLGKLWLVRDRAGVKPLYYYDDGKHFLFSSELKSFHKHPDFQKELNKEVLPYYFQFGYIPSPHTVFKHTHKLEAGHYLTLDLQTHQCEIVQYWSVDACYQKEKFDKSETQIVNELEALLTDAVELRMVSDVPVGVFLSGGYDSSLVTALLSKNKTRKLHTYTIGFEEKNYNEAEHAKEIAKHFDTEHTEYYVSQKELLEKVESLPLYYDEPFGDSSALPTMIVSELAKKDVKVVLSSDGGDEAFYGYSKYFFLEKFAPLLGSSFKKNILKGLLTLFNAEKIAKINSFLPQNMRQTNIRDKYLKFKRAMYAGTESEMFVSASSPVARRDMEAFLQIEPNDTFYAKFEMHQNISLPDAMMLTDYKTFMVDDVLTKVDRATMSNSLEGREPLLDHRIIEFMARVPSTLKYKNKQGKYLVRQILYGYIFPEKIDKPKAGFQIPLSDWLVKELKPLVEKYLDTERLDAEIYNVTEVKMMKQALFSGDVSKVNAIWFILMFEMWKEKWL